MPRFDVVIVGAGPAGSTAALCLARGGARVALVDRRQFPRDKACGDLVGPRGVGLLDALGVKVPGARRVGDMILVGPSGRRALLPASAGLDYPGHGLASQRATFDTALVEAAVGAGAELIHDRVVGLVGDPAAVQGVALSTGRPVRADVVIGADGALSRVAADAQLGDSSRTLWGFAVRGYLDVAVRLPHILLWEPRPWQPYPGYGWIFPTEDGRANVGLGLAVGAARPAARVSAECLADFMDHLARLGLVARAESPVARLGGWLKMGRVGTVPARGTVLLAGDAAGLINPLQGEGIAPAMQSGRAAAIAVLSDGPPGAAIRYRALLDDLTPHHRVNAPVQAGILGHPRAVSVAGRVLTSPGVRAAAAGAWALYWNDLVRGARPGVRREIARAAFRLTATLAARTDTAQWFRQVS